MSRSLLSEHKNVFCEQTEPCHHKLGRVCVDKMSEPKGILGLHLVFTESSCDNQLRSHLNDFTQFCSVVIRILQLGFICEQPPGNQSLKVLAQKILNTIAQGIVCCVYKIKF